MRCYLNEPVGELAKQLVAGLVRLRKGYVDAAEALLAILQPETEYPYEFIVYRLTGYRAARAKPIRPMSGRSLAGDLRRLILDLCDSFDLPAAAYGERAWLTGELSERFNVTTKTLQRWRRLGLVPRKLVLADGQKRIAFLESSVQRFVEARREALRRSARFTRLSRTEREDILRRATRMVRVTGCSLHEVSKRLSRRTGRAVETIRYTIRKHDRRQPDQAVFPVPEHPLDDQARDVIYRCFLQGVSVTALSRRYGRSRGSIYRVINETRARQLLARKIDYVYNPQFDLPGAEEAIFAAPPEGGDVEAAKPARVPKDLPEYLKELVSAPLLTAGQERRLFQQYNYLKYRADQARRKLDLTRVRARQLRQLERLLVRADAIKNQIIRANIRLVVSIAKKHLSGPQTLFELVSDGNLSLMRAVEKFDYARGFKFSTYGSWAIMKNFARSVPKERYATDRFVTGADEVMELVSGMGRYDPRSCTPTDLRDSLDWVLGQLSPRERSIIVRHFGLTDDEQPQTLEQLSLGLGISKERVRQIERGAMVKLRQMLQPVENELLR